VPIIQLKLEDELKVFDELVEAGPVTVLYPGDIFIVQEAHLKVLDDAGAQYVKKDRDAIRQSRLEWEKQRKLKNVAGIS